MFISVFDIFKIGLGPSSSHTSAPMSASKKFLNLSCKYIDSKYSKSNTFKIQCILKGSLGWTGKNHESDKAIILGNLY